MIPGASRVLILNGCGSIEGDIKTMLVALEALQHAPISITVISKPRGDVYRAVQQMPHVEIVSMELGGSEAVSEFRSSRAQQLADFAIAVVRIVHLVRKRKIDVLYTIDRGVAPQLAAIVSRLTGCPFVLNAAYPFYPENGTLARFVLRQARRIHVHSNYLRNFLLPFVRSVNTLTVIPYGLDLARYKTTATGEEIRQQFGIRATDPVVVMTGRISQYKGQDYLISAAATLLAEYPDLHVLIAGRGSGALTHELEQMIARLQIGHRVRLVGYVPSIPDFLMSGDIVAMPSWEEPFGLVALEAMAMARPIVATAAGGVPEFVKHGKFGLLVPPRDAMALANAIRQLIDDRSTAHSMGLAGRDAVVQTHTVECYARRVCETLLDAVGLETYLAGADFTGSRAL